MKERPFFPIQSLSWLGVKYGLWPQFKNAEVTEIEITHFHYGRTKVRKIESPEIQYGYFVAYPGTWLKSYKEFKHWQFRYSPFVVVQPCGLCGRFGSLNKVKTRWDCYGWTRDRTLRGFAHWETRDGSTNEPIILCQKCGRKARRINRKHDEAYEGHRMIEKMRQELREAKKRMFLQTTQTGAANG